jgi:hypothetical protein
MSTRLRHVLVALLVVGFAGTIGCQKRTETGGTEADTTMMTPPPPPPPSGAGADTSMMGADTSMAHDSM